MTSIETAPSRWPALAGAIVLLALLVALCFPSLQMMWHTWGDSNTYTHGYLVFPMAAYLIWTRWSAFNAVPQTPFPAGAAGLIACGVLWVVAELLNVHVIGQLMFVSSIVLLSASYFGLAKTLTILFPLAYLFFAVPMGEALVPKLMDFTADFTIWALTVTGIPVYRDGMFFSIPAGDFEVAKACSGIRYLMASFALGTLYAFLSFRSFKKQVLFSALSLVVPIVANGVRAYGIVMIAHFSDMKYAVGVDHLVYGWLFFGLVMFLLFMIGGKFRSSEDLEYAQQQPDKPAEPLALGRIVPIVALLGVAIALPHLLGSYARQTNASESAEAYLPAAASGWQGPFALETRFEPAFEDFSARSSGQYIGGDARIFVWTYRYPAFNAEREMITATNLLVDLDDWSVFQQVPITTSEGAFIQTDIGGRFDQYTAWHWYQVNNTVSNGLIKAKFSEAKALLSGTLNINEALVVVATPERGEEGIAALKQFLQAHGAALQACSITRSDECVTGVLP